METCPGSIFPCQVNATKGMEADKMGKKDIVISSEDSRIRKHHWVAFTRFLERYDDFYQLVAISSLVEARLQRIRLPGVESIPGSAIIKGVSVGKKSPYSH